MGGRPGDGRLGAFAAGRPSARRRGEERVRILVVSAHPDDEVLGPGGSIHSHSKAGHDVSILLACCGTNLRYGREEADRLRATSEKVAAMLGARRILFGDLPDQGLDTMTLTEVARRIEQTIAEVDPAAI